jgi:beta-glucosidase
MPTGWQNDFPTIQAPLDWCGINYYTRRLVRHMDGAWPNDEVSTDGPLPKTQMGWEVYPDGLFDFLMRTKTEYTGDLPLFVTENGMANADINADGNVDDPERIAFLNAHFDAVRRAIAAGAPVEGYFVWSLMDNYEWALGYEKRFGLVHVDFDTLKRTPKASYHALKSALER